MAAFDFVLFMATGLFLAVCSAAPTEDVEPMKEIKIPASCKDQQFCSVKPEGYDQLEEHINNALPEFLVKDFAVRYGPETPSEEPRLSPQEDWHNCPYETKTQSMYLYNHGGNNSKTEIFVQTKLFRQYVNVVTCATQHIQTDSKEQCFQGLGVTTFGMKSTCQASMAERSLFVFDIETKKIIQKTFKVPACCKCIVSNV